MTRLRWVAALLAAFLLVVLSAGPSSAAPADTSRRVDAAPTAPVTPDPGAAIDNLVGCVQGSKRLLALFLFDESASLRVTDPHSRRVDAAKSALTSLSNLAAGPSGTAPQVEVAMAAFSNNYRQVHDWTEAGPSTQASLQAALEQFRHRNHGIDTDFVNALNGARRALAEEGAAVTAKDNVAPCRMIVLFTDGGFDLALRTPQDVARLGATKPYAPGIQLTDPASVRRAETAGRSALCRSGGVADGLRSDGVTLVTVALSGGLSVKTQRPLAAAAAGTADKYPCGTRKATGAYLPASGVNVLLSQFDALATQFTGGTKVAGKATSNTRTFHLDPSLRRIHILALGGRSGTVLTLTGPGGTTKVTKPGPVTVGAATGTATAEAGGGFTVDIDRPKADASWSGEWKAVLTLPSGAKPPSSAVLQVFVFSDIGVQLDPITLQRGATANPSASLVVPAGIPADKLVTKATATLHLDDLLTGKSYTVQMLGPIAGPYKGVFPTPSGLTSSALSATVSLEATTAGGGTVVARSAPRLVIVDRPQGSVQFAPTDLQMPSVTGHGTTQEALVLIGGSGSGCVWFGPPKVSGPDGSLPVTVTVGGKPLPPQGACLKVAAGATVNEMIAVRPAGRATGSVSGTLDIHEQVGSAHASDTKLPFRFDQARGVDQGRRLLLAFLLFVGGLAAPMLLLVLINALSARFQDLDAIQGTALAVSVQGNDVLRRERGRTHALALHDDDFHELDASESKSRFHFGGIDFRARASRNPFGGAIAMAAPEGGAEKLKGREGSRVELDPSLAGSWIFLLDADKTAAAGKGRAEGTLIAFAAAGEVAPQADRMLSDIARRLPATALSLAGLVHEAAPRTARRLARGGHKAPLVAQPTETDADAEAGDDSPVTPADGEPTPDPKAPASPPPPPPAPAQTGATPSESAEPAPVGFGGVTPDSSAPPPPAPPATPAQTGATPSESAEPAPVGFGGITPGGSNPPAAAPAPEPPSEADASDEADAPPVGFGGVKPTDDDEQ